jgi:hypothetical protein
MTVGLKVTNLTKLKVGKEVAVAVPGAAVTQNQIKSE